MSLDIKNTGAYERETDENWAAAYAKRLTDQEAADRNKAIAAAIEVEEGKRVSSDNAIKDGTALEDECIYSRHIHKGNVTTGKIHDLNVTTEKIADEAVTLEKLNTNAYPLLSARDGNLVVESPPGSFVGSASGISSIYGAPLKDTWAREQIAEQGNVIADMNAGLATGRAIGRGAVTTAKIADEAVTLDKLDIDLTTYSTSPTRVGTWVDGTPVWRVAISKSLTAADFTAGYYQFSKDDLGVLDVSDVSCILNASLRRYYPNDDAEDSVPLQIVDSYKIALSGNTDYIVLRGFVEFVTSADNIKSE